MSEPVDTSRVFKQPVLCVSCDEAFYFTLSSIVEKQELECPHDATDASRDSLRGVTVVNGLSGT
jgi:hypothetical protein